MIETLLGGLLGGAFRLAPEILKWLDRKGEAILHAWTEADQALWAGVLNFWFLGRVFDRARS